jgi:hypothetical protein
MYVADCFLDSARCDLCEPGGHAGASLSKAGAGKWPVQSQVPALPENVMRGVMSGVTSPCIHWMARKSNPGASVGFTTSK